MALYGIQYGIFVGWTSPAVFLLTSDQSPLPTGKITTDEAGWTASIHSLGFLMSCPLFGYVGNRFGRKWPLIMLSVPISVMDAHISPLLLVNELKIEIKVCIRLKFISDHMVWYFVCPKYLLYIRGEICTRHHYGGHICIVTILFC